MSTRAGLNAQWQFPDTEGKDNQHTLKQSKQCVCGVVTRGCLSLQVPSVRKGRIPDLKLIVFGKVFSEYFENVLGK